MKNNKRDSDILDDNYFPEEAKEPKESSPPKFYFFKVIGYALWNSLLFTFSTILFSTILLPILFSIYGSNRNLEIFSILFLASTPFLYEFYRQIKHEDLLDTSWKIWVCILSFLGFIFISYIVFAISNFCFD